MLLRHVCKFGCKQLISLVLLADVSQYFFIDEAKCTTAVMLSCHLITHDIALCCSVWSNAHMHDLLLLRADRHSSFLFKHIIS
jgi:hypothetical protein